MPRTDILSNATRIAEPRIRNARREQSRAVAAAILRVVRRIARKDAKPAQGTSVRT